MSKAKKKRATAKASRPVNKASTAPTVPVQQTVEPIVDTSEQRFNNLQRWNKWLAVIYTIQGLALAVIGTSRTFPVVAHYVTADPLGKGAVAEASHVLADVRMASLLGFIMLIAAMIHALLAWAGRPQYEAALRKGMQPFRWLEYAFSQTFVLVAIALAAGVSDVALLVGLLILGFITNVLHLFSDQANADRPHERPDWRYCILSCITGTAAVLMVGAALLASLLYDGAAPGYAWTTYVTFVILVVGMGVVIYMQHGRKGRWTDTVLTEKTFMALSLMVKTLVAWEIFAGALRP